MKKTEKEKLDFLQSEGTYIGKRQIDDRTAILFQLGTFYVEVVYRDYRKETEMIKVSSSLDLLKPYIDQVDVSWLMEMENEK